MKKSIIGFFLVLGFLLGFGSINKGVGQNVSSSSKEYKGNNAVQGKKTFPGVKKNGIYVVVEEMPRFPGNLDDYISNNVRYPVIAQENRITGRVFVSFIIGKDGTVSNLKIVRPVDPSLDKESIRVIKAMPKWIPGKQDGKNVKVLYTIPINFQLEETKPIRKLDFSSMMPIPTNTVNEKPAPALIVRDFFSQFFSNVHKQPEWVCYGLLPEYVNGKEIKSQRFRDDKDLPMSGRKKDYKKSGYVKAQLCPWKSMRVAKEAVAQTFLMSNVCPQKEDFNNKVWTKLEGIVRNWVNKEGELYVISGAIFKDNLGVIGKNKVTVPGYFYKVVYDPTGEKKMIAFLLQHNSPNKSLKDCVVSVDKLEELTGNDFFSFIKEASVDELESKSDINKWSWE